MGRSIRVILMSYSLLAGAWLTAAVAAYTMPWYSVNSGAVFSGDAVGIAGQPGVGTSNSTNYTLLASMWDNGPTVWSVALPSGTSMLALPCQPVNTDPQSLFAFTGTRWACWDPTVASTNKYLLYPNTATMLGANTPGRAFWVMLDAGETVQVAGTAVPQADFSLPLEVGWNMVGNPWGTALGWDRTAITVTYGGVTKSLGDAEAAGWVEDFAWRYENTTGTGAYQLVGDATLVPGITNTIDAWRGCWIEAYQNCTLTFPTSTQRSGTKAVSRTRSANGSWSVHVCARMGAAAGEVILGEAPGAAKTRTVGLPPDGPTADATSLRIALTGAQGPVALDMRAGASQNQTWEFTVDRGTDTTDPVTLTWPDLTGVPGGVTLTLVDETTGTRRYLPTTASYSIPASRTGTQRFQIIADTTARQPLQLTGLRTTTTRGGNSVTFTLSARATVSVSLRTTTGRQVRSLAGAQTCEAGDHTILLGDTGTLPPGSYMVELLAVDEENRQSHAVTFLNVQ